LFTDRIGRLDLEDVTRHTFPLPRLKYKLESIAETLHNGMGFTVLRGLDPRKYSRFDNAIIYLGVTSYIAEIRACQDTSGNMFSTLSHLGYYFCLLVQSQYISKTSAILSPIQRCVNHLTPATLRFVFSSNDFISS